MSLKIELVKPGEHIYDISWGKRYGERFTGKDRDEAIKKFRRKYRRTTYTKIRCLTNESEREWYYL